MTYIIEKSPLYFHWIQEENPHVSKFNFSGRARKEIHTELEAIPSQTAKTLITELEGVVGRYLERAKFEAKLSTAQPLRKKLKKLDKTIKQFQEAAASLDWQTRRELGAALIEKKTVSINIHNEAKPPELVEFESVLCSTSDTLASISLAIDKIFSNTPKSRGGAKKKNRTGFLMEIIERINSITNGAIAIVGTRYAPFTNIVTTCLNELEGGKIKDSHRLIGEAVDAYRKELSDQGAKTSQK